VIASTNTAIQRSTKVAAKRKKKPPFDAPGGNKAFKKRGAGKPPKMAAEMMDAGEGMKPAGKGLPFGGGKKMGGATPPKPKRKKKSAPK
jgi:hypothetical protein